MLKQIVARARARLFPPQPTSQGTKWDLNRHRGRFHPERHVRQNVESFAIDTHSHIESFSKSTKLGTGVALSLFVHDEEILRIDCFGETGHIHACFFLPSRGPTRLKMRERAISDQVERALFEIRENFDYYKSRCSDPLVRKYEVDASRLNSACDQAEQALIAVLRSATFDTEEVQPAH